MATGYRLLISNLMCCIGVCGTSEQVHIGSVKLDNNRECELKLCGKKKDCDWVDDMALEQNGI